MESKKNAARSILRLLIVVGLVAATSLIPSSRVNANNWSQVLEHARGQTVDWYMYGGFASTNAYVNGYVASRVKELYGIKLRQVPVKDIAEVVSKILVEKQAGKIKGGEVDLMWINGENFRTCKRNDLLYGPFADLLPNQKLVDWNRASVSNDFGEPVEGLESPWGSAQVVMIYDSKRTPNPPRTVGGLLAWIKANPGRFTYPAPPDFTGSVFVRHVFYHVSGEVDSWQGEFDEENFAKAADKTYQVLSDLAPNLWRQGQTYPQSPVQLHQLLADGEVDFAMSYHPAKASEMIHDGLYPDSVRTFVFEEGTISNTHFVAIPFNASNKEGAMVVANFLISPEAQLQKATIEVWGDMPAIDIGRLDADWQNKFKNLPRGIATLSDAELQSHQLPEPPSEILIRLEKGWDQHVLKGR
ncbi:MAG: ABC transporter substrate-binding protein [Desulfobacterales bacterium]|nr:MAG: ABC transporter substrate-binding protein [Desulfobacterales bacterium]